MHKVTELSHDFLQSWKSGWPEYVCFPEKDSPLILTIAQECAKVIGVELDEEPGFKRVLIALKRIAQWCGDDKDWRKCNMYQINQAIQTIMQNMIAGKKSEEEALFERTAAQRVFEQSRTERGKAEKAMEEEKQRLQKEHEKNWTAEEEASYQAYMRKIELGRVISIDIAKEKHINKAL